MELRVWALVFNAMLILLFEQRIYQDLLKHQKNKMTKLTSASSSSSSHGLVWLQRSIGRAGGEVCDAGPQLHLPDPSVPQSRSVVSLKLLNRKKTNSLKEKVDFVSQRHPYVRFNFIKEKLKKKYSSVVVYIKTTTKIKTFR